MASLFQQAKQRLERANTAIQRAGQQIAPLTDHYYHTNTDVYESCQLIEQSLRIVQEQIEHVRLQLYGEVRRTDMVRFDDGTDDIPDTGEGADPGADRGSPEGGAQE